MRKIVLFVALFLVLLFSSVVSAQQPDWLPLEPSQVQLEGKLLKVLKYGPPNYGETPKSDARYEIPILLLTQPIRVKGDPASVIAYSDANRHPFRVQIDTRSD